MQQAVRAEGLVTESVYSVVFRTNTEGARFEVMNIVGERKTPAEIARDLIAAAEAIKTDRGS